MVGIGPSGLTAATILATADVTTIAISRHRGPANTPRATITNSRTMEVYRDLGVEEDIQSVGYSLDWLSNNVLATSFAGMELARYKSYGTGADRLSDYAAATPAQALNAPQHVVEPVLLAAARDRGADVRYGTELVEIRQEAEQVRSLVRDRGSGEEYEVISQFVIGADGGRSTVADLLEFPFDGSSGLRRMVNSWLEVDLTELVQHRPGVMYWIGQPGHEAWFGTSTWASVKPWNEWIMFYPWDEDELPSEEFVIERARLSIGDDDIPVRVKSITAWQVNNIVASEYGKGRVFLSGDAAHRHPPAGGLGSNTSIQDAFNLGWKLIWVLRGLAGPELLETYSAERQPVGAHVVRRANQSWDAQAGVINALGFEEGQSAEAGWASLDDLYSGSSHATERRTDLAKALEQLNYRSNAIGVELGQRYTSAAVVDDGTPFPAPERDPELYYEPTTHPGAHLPHAWIEHERQQVSTVDLVGHGRFSLLVGVDGSAWSDAMLAVAAEFGLELDRDVVVMSIGLRCQYDDVIGDWARVREVNDAGAVLVRPDRHVAWRSVGPASNPTAVLRSVFAQILARETPTSS